MRYNYYERNDGKLLLTTAILNDFFIDFLGIKQRISRRDAERKWGYAYVKHIRQHRIDWRESYEHALEYMFSLDCHDDL